MVAVDNAENLKAAAYGAVPSDVLAGQTSRDGEDCAAALAGHITMDPLTLRPSMGQSGKPWALGVPGVDVHPS